VSGVPGAKTHVYTPAPGGSEAQNGMPDSILSSEPKPLVQHRPPPLQSVWSPDGLMAFTEALIDAVTTILPSPPLPPPLYIPPSVDRRDDIFETEVPPRKRLCLSTLGCRYEIGGSSTARPTRAPPSPDYIPGPEEPQTPPIPQDEDEQDEHVLPAEEQPLPPIDSPTVESPGYVAKSNPEEDPEEYEDDETEDGPIDYPMDGGDNGDDNNGDSSGDDADDEDEDEEEEEHLASADSAIVIPTVELVSLP
nr:hypothetical protein [Tanacetum cinerariifolium]